MRCPCLTPHAMSSGRGRRLRPRPALHPGAAVRPPHLWNVAHHHGVDVVGIAIDHSIIWRDDLCDGARPRAHAWLCGGRRRCACAIIRCCSGRRGRCRLAPCCCCLLLIVLLVGRDLRCSLHARHAAGGGSRSGGGRLGGPGRRCAGLTMRYERSRISLWLPRGLLAPRLGRCRLLRSPGVLLGLPLPPGLLIHEPCRPSRASCGDRGMGRLGQRRTAACSDLD